MKKKKKRYISQRKKKKERDHFGDWEKKRMREKILRREKRRKHTKKEKTRHQECFFPFCLYIHSWHKIKSTHNYSYFINMHLHERIISLTKKMQASKPFSEPYKHHISTKTPLTTTQEQNYVYPDFLSCIEIRRAR